MPPTTPFDILFAMFAFLFAILTNAAQLANALRDGKAGETFELHATVTYDCQPHNRDFAVEDTAGTVVISPPRSLSNATITAGTRILTRGELSTSRFGHIYAQCQSIERIGTTRPPAVPTVTIKDILSGAYDARPVRTSGILRDFFRDELDPEFIVLIVNQDDATLYASIPHREKCTALDSLLGQSIPLYGLCDPHPSGSRRKIGRLLRLRDIDEIENAAQSSPDPFKVPLLSEISRLQPDELVSSGRCRALGRVLAVWHPNMFLIKTPKGETARVELISGQSPHPGDDVEIVGFPETDLYRINFTRAMWRPASRLAVRLDAVTGISANDLMTNYKMTQAVNADLYGRTVCLRGIVRSLPSVGNDGRFYLESDGYTLPVDISANPVLAEKLEIGSVIDVTGVCVMDIENWRPNLVFPHIKEVMIVTRTPDDIVVIRRPPWWTPARLMIVIGSLLAVLVGILIWNRALKALAEKRGKALANEELERLESDLKVCERTRLAVELHDSIAQNLTGVSMEIDTALRGDEPLPPAAAQHMGRALRTIDSCRGELRNCLWDLRSQALEEEDMNKAIRLTLSQTIGKANLIVRFNVPRSRFTDNTAHTLLRIIRELAANAVRHGHATEIKVAGSIEDNVLKFSVRDNGCGFDPDACPGVLDGHFGLQGVRERVASFEGNLRIESAPGKGTRISVSINAPQGNDKEKL